MGTVKDKIFRVVRTENGKDIVCASFKSFSTALAMKKSVDKKYNTTSRIQVIKEGR